MSVMSSSTPLGKISKSLFADRKELMDFASKFVSERIESLENDVKRCTALQEEFLRHSRTAPFPALLYCFSTIDLLGALYAGNARPGATTDNACKYMVDFMSYTRDQVDMIQGVFRHKIVHLAQPRPITLKKSKRIAWYIETQYHPRIHLKLEELPPEEKSKKYGITSKLVLQWDQVFYISVQSFQRDIKESVEKSDGYLARLANSPTLQESFSKAILEIHSPNDR